MAHGAQLLSETRLMVNFQKEDERYGGPIRYLGSRAIFLYPNVPRGRDLDFPYTNLRLLFVLHVQVVFCVNNFDRKMEGTIWRKFAIIEEKIKFGLSF